MLLTEFDEARDAVINPDIIHTRIPDFPETVERSFVLHYGFHRLPAGGLPGQKVVGALGGFGE